MCVCVCILSIRTILEGRILSVDKSVDSGGYDHRCGCGEQWQIGLSKPNMNASDRGTIYLPNNFKAHLTRANHILRSEEIQITHLQQVSNLRTIIQHHDKGGNHYISIDDVKTSIFLQDPDGS